MRILSLETTDRIGGVAALEGETLLAETALPADTRSARSLVPAAKSLLEQVGWRPAQLDLVAVAVGPGSFTGLRVGVTAAKTLAYGAGAEILGVNTLEVIAHRAPRTAQRLSVVMDAQRRQLFLARYAPGENASWREIEAVSVVDMGEWLASLTADDTVTGPGLRKLVGEAPDCVTVVDSSLWSPTAAMVGQLAVRQYESGRRDDLWTLVPQYFRPSAAEEKWAAKHRESGASATPSCGDARRSQIGGKDRDAE